MPAARNAPRLLCGVDEAGRGPIAGPVYAAAVILDPRQPIYDELQRPFPISEGKVLRCLL